MTKPKEVVEVVEEDVFTSREEYIGCCYNALMAIDGVDAMTKEDRYELEGVKKKCISIIAMLVNEMYDELFSEDND